MDDKCREQSNTSCEGGNTHLPQRRNVRCSYGVRLGILVESVTVAVPRKHKRADYYAIRTSHFGRTVVAEICGGGEEGDSDARESIA